MNAKLSIGERNKIEDIANKYIVELDGYEQPTLKDIAVILYAMCGHGVSWNLAYELSKILNTSYDETAYALDEIVFKYSNLSDAEATDKFYNNPELSDKYFKKVRP